MTGTMQFSKYENTIKKQTKQKKHKTQSEYILCAKANRRFHFPFTSYAHSAPSSPQIKMTAIKSKLHTSFRKRIKQKIKQIKAVHL